MNIIYCSYSCYSIPILDHDGSVAQSAIILPLLNDAVRLTTSSDAKIINTKNNTCTNEQDISCHSVNKYPYLLSLHGTGLSPLSQADAYKDMPSGKTEYRFGVSGMFVIAPDRYGAHNWEVIHTYLYECDFLIIHQKYHVYRW